MSYTATQNDAGTREIWRKLQLVLTGLQCASAAYFIWVLWLICAPIVNRSGFEHWVSQVWPQALTPLQTWQLAAYFGLDLVNWGVMLGAGLGGWRAMASIKRGQSAQGQGELREGDRWASHQLRIGAWLALASEVLSIVMRPIKSWVLTFYASAESLHVRWSFSPHDLLVFILCLTLLCLAYVWHWKVMLADENRGFV